MGVDKRDYVIIGYKMPYDVKKTDGKELAEMIWEDEKYIRFAEGRKDEQFRFVDDGMMGKYIVFGKLKASASEYEGFDFIELEINPNEFEEVKTKTKEILNDVDFDFDNPKTLIFSHYH